jgi:hypothetical protein
MIDCGIVGDGDSICGAFQIDHVGQLPSYPSPAPQLKQPGRNRSGTISIAVSSDGNSFAGSGTLSNGRPITWQSTKKLPAAH